MRTTITLEPDVAALVERLMDERSLTFKRAINETLRAGLAGSPSTFEQTTHDLGTAMIDLDKASRVAAALEDEALMAKHELRK